MLLTSSAVVTKVLRNFMIAVVVDETVSTMTGVSRVAGEVMS